MTHSLCVNMIGIDICNSNYHNSFRLICTTDNKILKQMTISVTFIRQLLMTTVLIFISTLFIGCAKKNMISDADLENAFLLPVKFHKQEPNKCAVAALSSVLDYFDIEYSGIDTIYSERDNGTKLITMVNYANQYINTDVKRIGYKEIEEIILAKKPLIIMRNVNSGYHYYVVKGFIPGARRLIVSDGYNETILLSTDNEVSDKKIEVAVIFGQDKKENLW